MENHIIYYLKTGSDIQSFIDDIISYGGKADKSRLRMIFSNLTLPFSILFEKVYNDKTYRDSYYNHFSSKYTTYKKDASRIALFESNTILEDDFFSKEGHLKLQKLFIGTIVLKPISPGTVGKTLLNPSKMNLGNCAIRLTSFECVVLGVRLNVKSFPFSSQDSETMTCAETAIWSLMKYYGTRYPVYKMALPNDIHRATNANSFQRILPSTGLAYTQSSSALKDFGFFPRYYSSINPLESCNKLKRYLYYYIASGIPMLCGVNLKKQNVPSGHLIVSIGFDNNIDYSKATVNSCHNGKSFKDVAEMVEKYSFMDDNQTPFSIQSFENFEFYLSNTNFDSTNIKYLIAPLYKRIFLTAENASIYFYNIFKNPKIGLNMINGENEFIINIFLASSRRYKNFRSTEYSSKSVAKTYLDLPLPKFIWVAEISTEEMIKQGNIIGEVILNATAFGNNVNESIITIHYPGIIAVRKPDEEFSDLIKKAKTFKEEKSSYASFSSNLTLIT